MAGFYTNHRVGIFSFQEHSRANEDKKLVQEFGKGYRKKQTGKKCMDGAYLERK